MHPLNELKKAVEQAEQIVHVGKLYYHHRNPEQLYKVLSIAIDEKTDTPCIIYQALYGDNIIWVRSLYDWCENVVHQGTLVPRFIKYD